MNPSRLAPQYMEHLILISWTSLRCRPTAGALVAASRAQRGEAVHYKRVLGASADWRKPPPPTRPPVTCWQTATDAATRQHHHSTTAGRVQLPKHPPTDHRHARPGHGRPAALTFRPARPREQGSVRARCPCPVQSAPQASHSGLRASRQAKPCPGRAIRSGRCAGGESRQVTLTFPSIAERRSCRRPTTAGDRPGRQSEARQAAYNLTTGQAVKIQLCCQKPTIDRYCCAMYVAGEITRQHQRHAGDFIRLTGSPDRQSPRKINPAQQ